MVHTWDSIEYAVSTRKYDIVHKEKEFAVIEKCKDLEISADGLTYSSFRRVSRKAYRMIQLGNDYRVAQLMELARMIRRGDVKSEMIPTWLHHGLFKNIEVGNQDGLNNLDNSG